MQSETFLVDKNSTIKDVMRVIDRNRMGIAFLVDENKKFFGTVTDGDIRGAILRGVDIGDQVQKIVNRTPIVAKEGISKQDIIELRNQENVRQKIQLAGSLKIPVLTEDMTIKDVLFIYSDRTDFLGLNPKVVAKNSIKKVLVLGGAGYLGSVLCRKLLNKGYKVTVLDNLTYGDDGIKELRQNSNFKFINGDIRNISEIMVAIKGMDAVIHLAGIVGDPACAKDPEETIEINYLATKMIAETCKYFQINRFVFASTCSVYGESLTPEAVLTETSRLNPVSLYAETKIKCEQSLLDIMDENFSPTILRMATLYGYSSNMRFDLVVNLLTAKALFDKKITIFGGDQWRPWLHLEDAAEAYINCLEAPIEKVRGEVFNVLSENYKVIDIGKIIGSVCPGAESEISKKTTDRRSYNVSSDKIYRTLKFSPKKKIKDGVTEIKNAIEKGTIKDYKESKYRISSPRK